MQRRTPAWPGLDREIADHYDRIVRDIGRPPILMGHSFGGLVTQLLADRGLGAAAVSIAAAPPKGVVLLPWSSIRTAWPALKNPANRRRSFALSPQQFRYRFGNTMSRQESDAVYERHYVPGTGRILFQAALANLTPQAATTVDFRRPGRAPMLLIAGEQDHVAPPRWSVRPSGSTEGRRRSSTTRSTPDARTTSAASGGGKRSPTTP